MEEQIRKIEDKMRKMADAWISEHQKPGSCVLGNTARQTNSASAGLEDHEIALPTIQQQLACLRRMARSGHPGYDANQHIQLKSALLGYEKAGLIEQK